MQKTVVLQTGCSPCHTPCKTTVFYLLVQDPRTLPQICDPYGIGRIVAPSVPGIKRINARLVDAEGGSPPVPGTIPHSGLPAHKKERPDPHQYPRPSPSDTIRPGSVPSGPPGGELCRFPACARLLQRLSRKASPGHTLGPPPRLTFLRSLPFRKDCPGESQNLKGSPSPPPPQCRQNGTRPWPPPR